MAKNKKKPTFKPSQPGRQSSAGRLTPGQQTRRRSPFVWVSLAALVVLAIALSVVLARQRNVAVSNSTTATPAPFAGVQYKSQGHPGHLPGDMKRYARFRYNSDPPTSGFHREIFTSGFVATTPIPKYVQVHLLEHGNVLLQYNCMCPDTVNALTRIAAEFDSRVVAPGSVTPSSTDVQNAEEQGLAVIVAPYPGMPSPIALTAWTRLGALQHVDDAKIVSFINLYLHNVGNLNS